ncbi:Helix-turn-helix domain-containing protein [Paraburkholderia phenazinium]|uniref:Helix-turn-helix domain-containing protein n=2 Tax=Paraburkholderia phenazinium TaxID=60549 RepID=A0A1N6KP83_9BURK|nr:Helix-turn-helix domain-containing protein [Paraburkholderia phenazinium]
MNQAWRTSLATGPKFVLVAICDTANDEGVCWPSVATISARTSMGERTVQRHLEDLEKAGLVTRTFRRGRSTNYLVHEGKFPYKTPAKLAPPQDIHPRQIGTPAKLATTPVNDDVAPPPNSTETPAKLAPRTTSNLKKNHQGTGAPPKDVPAVMVEPKASARGARLPKDWILSRSLGLWAATEQPTWTPEHIRKVAAAFKDHWIAQPGVKGRKTDWDATWRNWVRKEGPMAGASSRYVESPVGDWWVSDAGITAKGEELQVPRQKDEATPYYLVRVAKAAGRGPWIDHVLKAAQRVSAEWQQKVVAHLGEALMPTDWYAS